MGYFQVTIAPSRTVVVIGKVLVAGSFIGIDFLFLSLKHCQLSFFEIAFQG